MYDSVKIHPSSILEIEYHINEPLSTSCVLFSDSEMGLPNSTPFYKRILHAEFMKKTLVFEFKTYTFWYYVVLRIRTEPKNYHCR